MALLLEFPLSARAYDLRFDYTSFGSTFGQAQFDILNYPSINGSYMMTSSDNHRPEMVAKGNALAEFYNWLQDRYSEQSVKDGAAAADSIHQYTLNNSTNNGPRPDWLILNEISSSLWSANAGPPSISTYRTWLIDCVARLHDYYGYNVITLAPFQNPGANDASWQALAEVSYIGIECYLSGVEVWNSGNNYASRLSWAQNQYQSSKNSYVNRGVPASRLFLVEHFANNDSTYTDNQGNVLPTGWGRAGLASPADWDSVIQIRQDAIFNVGFDGFLAYNWGGNAMSVAIEEQIQHELYYRTRRVLASEKPQWLSDGALTVGGSVVPLSWNQGLHWKGGVPNASGAEANFWRTISANRTITLDGSKTVGSIAFDSPFGYSISPGTGGFLTLNNPDATAVLTSGQGSHHIGVNVQLSNGLSATIEAETLTIGGNVSGVGGLVKSGGGMLVLNGTNTYSGDTVIQDGTLSLAIPSLSNFADVRLSQAASLDLKFAGSPDVVRALYIDGNSMFAGIWGAVGSGAQYTTPLITGTGRLKVTEFIPLPLAGDYNRDGVVSLADYAIWRDHLGSGDSLANDDTQSVADDDYVRWRTNYGDNSGMNLSHDSSSEPVPERAACELLIMGLLTVAWPRFRKVRN